MMKNYVNCIISTLLLLLVAPLLITGQALGKPIGIPFATQETKVLTTTLAELKLHILLESFNCLTAKPEDNMAEITYGNCVMKLSISQTVFKFGDKSQNQVKVDKSVQGIFLTVINEGISFVVVRGGEGVKHEEKFKLPCFPALSDNKLMKITVKKSTTPPKCKNLVAEFFHCELAPTPPTPKPITTTTTSTESAPTIEETEEETPVAISTEAPKEGGGSSTYIIIAIAVVVVVCALAGVGLFMTSGSAEDGDATAGKAGTVSTQAGTTPAQGGTADQNPAA